MRGWNVAILAGVYAVALLVGCGDQASPVDAAQPGTPGAPAVPGSADGAAGSGAATPAAPVTPDASPLGGTPAGDPGTAGGGSTPAEGSTPADGSTPTDGSMTDGTAATDAGWQAPADADFYPVLAGANWVYRHEGGSTTWNEEVSISDTTFDGTPALEVSDTPGPSGSHTVAIYVSDAVQVRRVHKEVRTGSAVDSVVDYTPGFARFDTTWLGMDVGAAMDLGYRRVEVDGTGAPVSDEERLHTYELMARGSSVTVPAGTFDDCIEVRRERQRAAGTMPGPSDLKTFWFCADVGKVKEVDHGTGSTESLVSCSLPACGG